MSISEQFAYLTAYTDQAGQWRDARAAGVRFHLEIRTWRPSMGIVSCTLWGFHA